ncbi:MAG: DHH family phosphoesterase [Fusobacteriaceae bacterium]
MQTLKEIGKKIIEKNNIIITTHLNPDGDGLGAGMALYHGLKKIGKKQVRFLIEDIMPGNLKFLNKDNCIERCEKFEMKDEDLLICVDAADISRVGHFKNLKGKIEIINIDHHISNDYYGEYNYVETESASASEIVYELLKEMQIPLDKEMATGIYTGIVNDTGNFRHSNVRPSTFLIASDLIEKGANNDEILRVFFDVRTMAGTKLLGRALEKAVYLPETKLVYSLITQKDYREVGGNKFDTDTVINNLLSLDVSEVALFIREEESGSYKGSLRTKREDLDLNSIAGIFGGGGHKKASGFSSSESIEKIIEKTIEILSKKG